MESLRQENSSLREELEQMRVDCQKLVEENTSLSVSQCPLHVATASFVKQLLIVSDSSRAMPIHLLSNDLCAGKITETGERATCT